MRLLILIALLSAGPSAFAETDLADAWDKAVSDPACGKPKGPGCVFQLECREYRTSRPLVFARPMQLIGCGESTVIKSKGPAALVIPLEGARSTVRDLVLDGGRQPRTTGILMRGRARVERVSVTGFGVGIHVDTRKGAGNANGWAITDAAITWAGAEGLRVEGDDSNGGRAAGLSVTYACSQQTITATTPPALRPDCAAVTDASFLGNTYIAPLVHGTFAVRACSSSRPPEWCRFPWMKTVNPNARTLILNAYAEIGNNGAAELVSPTMVVGGHNRIAEGSTAWVLKGTEPFVAQARNQAQLILGGPKTRQARISAGRARPEDRPPNPQPGELYLSAETDAKGCWLWRNFATKTASVAWACVSPGRR